MGTRVLLTGASGYFGAYLLREARHRGHSVTAWSGSQTGELFGVPLHPVDLARKDRVASAFRAARPTLVIHAAAWTTMPRCYQDPPSARRINVDGTCLLAELAAEAHARLLLVSTDLVFDGVRGGYGEQDTPAPASVYGQTKVEAEQALLACPNSVVVRASLLFGPSLSGRPSFFDQQIDALRDGRTCVLFKDEWRTPLGLATAAEALLGIARSGYQGRLHVGGPERLSRLEMGERLAGFLGSAPSTLVPAERPVGGSTEPRPRDVSLDSSLWRDLFPAAAWPSWDEDIRRMTRDLAGRPDASG